MSLRDSGTKSKKLLRILAVFAVVAVLFVSTGVIAMADTVGAETSVEQGDAETFKSGYPKLPADADLGTRLMYGVQVACIGMVVVFLVLILIMAILYVFKLVATSGAKKSGKKDVAAPVASAPAAPAQGASDEATIVAVATAAIAASRGSSNCAFKVISVTKIQ